MPGRASLRHAIGVATTAVALVTITLTVASPAPVSADTPPATITLTGPVRDFEYGTVAPVCSKSVNADFENGFGDDRGFVADTLGADGTPTYVGGSGTRTTHGATSFKQWYHDTPGTNVRAPHSVTLSKVADDTPLGYHYHYESSAFFPIDKAGWADPSTCAKPQLSGGHNFSFTYLLHTVFTYQGGETFSFSGDDDVFVFINKKKVVDLGGVHTAQSATVDLDAVAADLDISPGNTYDFDFFYAERHTTQSNFKMDTSIALNQPPIVDAGSPYSGVEGSGISVTGTVSDPEKDPVTTKWTITPQAGTTGTCTFADAAALSTTVTCTEGGTYNLTLSADDGHNLPVTSTTTLTVADAPAAVPDPPVTPAASPPRAPAVNPPAAPADAPPVEPASAPRPAAQLPRTGLPAGPLTTSGLALMAAGALVRRLGRRR